MSDGSLVGAHEDGVARLERQLAALREWTLLHREQQQALVPPQRASRERHLELRWRAEALDREAHVLRERCSAAIAHPDAVQAVLIHRQPWLLQKLTAGLAAAGVQVVATADDGPTGSGLAIAEAPELVFLESSLPAMTGADVVRRLRRCTPTTLIGAQVAHEDDVQGLLQAGAATVWTRAVPPADMVVDLLRRLADRVSPARAWPPPAEQPDDREGAW